MKTTEYRYKPDGFEAVLYDAGNGDDRLLIVIQGLKGLLYFLTSGRKEAVQTTRYLSKRSVATYCS